MNEEYLTIINDGNKNSSELAKALFSKYAKNNLSFKTSIAGSVAIDVDSEQNQVQISALSEVIARNSKKSFFEILVNIFNPKLSDSMLSKRILKESLKFLDQEKNKASTQQPTTPTTWFFDATDVTQAAPPSRTPVAAAKTKVKRLQK